MNIKVNLRYKSKAQKKKNQSKQDLDKHMIKPENKQFI